MTMLLTLVLLLQTGNAPTTLGTPNVIVETQPANGYQGCWYSNGKTNNEYKFKYSGGLGTYPQQHAPIAVYSQEAHKTFFVFGGKHPTSNSILHMVSYFDHATGMVPKPRILLDKKTDDAHDNPTLAIDPKGHLLIFSNAHGTARPSFVHRSVKPYSIDQFEMVWETNFSYASPWLLPTGEILLLHTKYNKGRGLHLTKSNDGRQWSTPVPVAKIQDGDYQISWPGRAKIATVFDHHPAGKGLDYRTNMYYIESRDAGKSWLAVTGEPINLPINSANNPVLVHDFAKEKKLVYLKDLNYDADDRPVILFLTSSGHLPGAESGPHAWHTARWTGTKWEIHPFAMSDHNYDHGSLYVEPDGTWNIIAPLGAGPQPFGTGGEMQLWTSRDQGWTWEKVRDLTNHSPRNHTYARRPLHAHPDFYAIWADGDARKRSDSSLYFTNRDGSKVFRLPAHMSSESVKPDSYLSATNP